MPLSMDIHYVEGIAVEDTRKAHLADLAVQEKYGVTYHQYGFNQEAGTIYCLMEGPGKESCAATHARYPTGDILKKKNYASSIKIKRQQL